jgi:Zn-dependent membrane protease YugP
MAAAPTCWVVCASLTRRWRSASFGKALPVLVEGNYIQPQDEAAVRRILQAAALTYVAGSLASLLNLARWLAFLRRV